MKKLNKIITDLRIELTPFSEIHEFSSNPGIYAVGFTGDHFPFPTGEDIVKKGDIIYIGKTEKSQRSRDAQTHFKSGRTGSSTLRRSLGAILREELNLKPIPRSYSETRMRDYKFIEESEIKLTEWMIDNLSLSYHAVFEGDRMLKYIEKTVIEQLSPILNIQGNLSLNPYAGILQELRKKCRTIAKIEFDNINE
jgi:hypothetical protein